MRQFRPPGAAAQLFRWAAKCKNKSELTMLIRVLLFIAISCMVLTSCSRGANLPPNTPNPPSTLLSLPDNAQILCHNDPKLNSGGIYVWELPGLEPTDRNSGYMGRRGRALGLLEPCTIVTATDYAWSETDQVFWVYIKAEDAEGWVKLDLLSFSP